jgi:hypothetical protein
MANKKTPQNTGLPRQLKRGYSDFFTWPVDRQLEEWAIAEALKESLEKSNAAFFNALIARGRGNDPPDCEAVLLEGGKLGIEVTELVDPHAILAYKNGDTRQQAVWGEAKLVNALCERIRIKDIADNVKGGPYDQYMLLVHADEPMLDYDYLNPLLADIHFPAYHLINRAFLLMSYDKKYQCCPYIELTLNKT